MDQNSPVIRRYSTPVQVANVTVGGYAPIVVQSMTNTDTANVEATAAQAYALHEAGSELVRITVNTPEAAKAIPAIYEKLQQMGWKQPALIGDFHYNGHILLTDYPDCAVALSKYRINPGNVGFGDRHDKNFATMIEVANRYERPVRIGVNWGSLDQELVARMMDENSTKADPEPAERVYLNAMKTSALASARQAEQLGMPANRIILACKVSEGPMLVRLYRELAKECTYALHLGLTEAGMGSKGIVATASALGILLSEGIGDTIRASLTPEPNGDRRLEVRVCQEILQALDLRSFTPSVAACPGCGRTTSQVYQNLALAIQSRIAKQMPDWKVRYPGIERLKVAVMGCVVNGPGESKHADIGISLPGTGEMPAAPVYIDGKKYTTLRGERIAEDFIALLETYIENRFNKQNTTVTI